MAINQAGVYAVSALLIFFSTLAFGLRVGVRWVKEAPIKSDDYLSGLATVCALPHPRTNTFSEKQSE